jgi:hypothetical protein
MDTINEFIPNKSLKYIKKIRVYSIEKVMQIVVIIFLFVYSMCVCGQTGNDIVIKSIGGLEEFPVLSVDNKSFILHQFALYSTINLIC